MKFFKKYQLLFYFLLLVFSGCSNWIENPVTELTKQKITIPNTVTTTNFWNSGIFPTGTNSMYIYNSSINYAGTADGKIYFSSNNCWFWNLVAEVANPNSINCLLYYYEQSIFGNREYTYASTDSAIYKSTALGQKWQEVCNFKTAKLPIKINKLAYDKGYLYCVGKSNNFNVLKTSNFGYSWETASISESTGEIRTIVFQSGTKLIYHAGIKSGSRGLIYSWYDGSVALNDFGEGTDINSLIVNSTGWVYTGTSKGIYLSKDYGKTWAKSGLDNYDVRFLEIHSDLILFAGTSDGLFTSFDMGIKWSDISPYPDDVSVDFMQLSKNNRLYLRTTKNNFYYADIIIPQKMYNNPPLLYSPVNNESNVSSNLSFSWGNLPRENFAWHFLQVSLTSAFSKSDLVCYSSWLKSQSCIVSLKNQTKYYWRVRSQIGIYSTSWSDIYSFTTK